MFCPINTAVHFERLCWCERQYSLLNVGSSDRLFYFVVRHRKHPMMAGVEQGPPPSADPVLGFTRSRLEAEDVVVPVGSGFLLRVGSQRQYLRPLCRRPPRVTLSTCRLPLREIPSFAICSSSDCISPAFPPPCATSSSRGTAPSRALNANFGRGRHRRSAILRHE